MICCFTTLNEDEIMEPGDTIHVLCDHCGNSAELEHTGDGAQEPTLDLFVDILHEHGWVSDWRIIDQGGLEVEVHKTYCSFLCCDEDY